MYMYQYRKNKRFSILYAICILFGIYLLSQTILERGNDILTYGEKGAWGKKRLRTTGLKDLRSLKVSKGYFPAVVGVSGV